MTTPKTYWIASLISRQVAPIRVISEAGGLVQLESRRRVQTTTQDRWIRPTFEDARLELEMALREQMHAIARQLEQARIRLQRVEAMESPDEGASR